jgi:hypothetical protein
MKPDTLQVPLWTGAIGAGAGILGSYVAARAATNVATEQIRAQRETADQQLRATVVAANRLRWIEQLRSEIAAFASLVIGIATDLRTGATRDAVHPKIDKANDHAAMVNVLLNFDEVESGQLRSAMTDAENHIQRLLDNRVDHKDVAEVEACVDRVTGITRAILKKEWQRVKSLS